MSETAEEKERRVVAECRHHLPAEMNKGDGEVLLSLLDTIGVLTDYLDAVAGAEGKSRVIRFSTYFNFEHHVKLDSEGRITFLYIKIHSDRNLPPIIERLQKLQRIYLFGCQLLPIELGNLPLLESITFVYCGRALFENIPEGLLLSSLKKVEISGIRGSYPTLSAFWKMLPDTLEKLLFFNPKGEQSEEILCALQNHDFGFRDSLTEINMLCGLHEGNLERLLFDILPRFANLHTLNLEHNNIKSLQGIEDRIKKLERISSSSSSSPPSLQNVMPVCKLRKLSLIENPVFTKVSNKASEKVAHDPKEVAALITILDAFDGIYYIGGESQLVHYPSDVEYLLRINHAGRKFIKEGESNNPLIKLALWPKILEKADRMSAGIYVNRFRYDAVNSALVKEEVTNRKKCPTGLFHLVRHFYGPLLAENHRRRSCDNRETLAASSSAVAALSTAEDRVGVGNKDAFNHKRKHS